MARSDIRRTVGIVLAVLAALLAGRAALALEGGAARSGAPETPAALQGEAASGDVQRENTAALMREWAEDVAYAYLDAWSSENKTALTGFDHLYAAQVMFFGRRIERAAVRDDKLRFARRWPIRHYDPRPATMNIACDVEAKLCRVRSVLDYRAESPLRHARTEGSAEFELGISFAGLQPEIVYESGRVLRIRSASN